MKLLTFKEVAKAAEAGLRVIVQGTDTNCTARMRREIEAQGVKFRRNQGIMCVLRTARGGHVHITTDSTKRLLLEYDAYLHPVTPEALKRVKKAAA